MKTQSINRLIKIILCTLALTFAGCAPADVGNQNTQAKARLTQGIWSVSHYLLADAEIGGSWVLDAGGRTGYADIDTAQRTITLTHPDGRDLTFYYIQADYLPADDADSHDVTMALYHPQAGRFGMFAYNLQRNTFVFRYGLTWAAGTITRTRTGENVA